MVIIYFLKVYFLKCAGSILGNNLTFRSLCTLPVFVYDESIADTEYKYL